jgi:hypothetical protein
MKALAKPGIAQIPPDVYSAVNVAIIDLGLQKNTFQGEERTEHRVYFCWEVDAEGKPLIGMDVTLSVHEKSTLFKWVLGRTGKPPGVEYDVGEELGKKCRLNIIDKNGYSKIGGVIAPGKADIPDPTRKPFLFDLDAGGDFDVDGRAVLPSWLPWLYGRPLADVIASRVVKNGAVAESIPY